MADRPEPQHARAPGATLRFGGGEPVGLVLVRHGVTTMTDSGAYSGSADPGPSLTEVGREQASRAASILARLGGDLWPDFAPISRVVASPMVRTQETGEVLATALDVSRDTDARLAECNFGQWEGLTSQEVSQRWPDELRTWHTSGTAQAPGGESMDDVGRRFEELALELARTDAGRTVVLAAHTVVIRAAVGRLLRIDPGHWFGLRVPPASVTILRLWADGQVELTVLGLPGELAEPALSQ